MPPTSKKFGGGGGGGGGAYCFCVVSPSVRSSRFLMHSITLEP